MLRDKLEDKSATQNVLKADTKLKANTIPIWLFPSVSHALSVSHNFCPDNDQAELPQYVTFSCNHGFST